MATNITITKRIGGEVAAAGKSGASSGDASAKTGALSRLPGWVWFVALWCFGVGSAMSLGFAFKLLMNATLFAVK